MKCDASTFTKMYEEIYIDLYRFALCLMKDSQEAEDMVSETVLAAYENIHKLRDKDAYKKWIFTILVNKCKKRWNKQKPTVNLDEISEKGEEQDYELSLDIKKAFFVLTPEEQQIIGLSVYGGYSSAEIGGMMKLNANTVRSKRSRALEKMKCVLK